MAAYGSCAAKVCATREHAARVLKRTDRTHVAEWMQAELIDWGIALIEGLILGSVLYVCVRLRMTLAPAVVPKFGQAGRWLIWVITIVLMIVIANVGLILLRTSMFGLVEHSPSLASEGVFALTAMIFGSWLVVAHRRRTADPLDSNC